MKIDFKKFDMSRMGLLAALGVILGALWLVIAYGVYEENQRLKYEVTIHPGAVTYGTHSTAVMPSVTMRTNRAASPMISGDAVREYARYGHTESYTSHPTSFTLFTTSSATVKSVGGGGSSTHYTSHTTQSNSSARGIRYGSATSVPVLAWASTSSMSGMSETSAMRMGPSVRKAAPGSGGTDGEWQETNPGEWWYYDEDQWVSPWAGASRPAGGGNFWLWDGTQWILVDDQGDPIVQTPVGATPWLLILLLAAGYVTCRSRRKSV